MARRGGVGFIMVHRNSGAPVYTGDEIAKSYYEYDINKGLEPLNMNRTKLTANGVRFKSSTKPNNDRLRPHIA